jgi:hypothetical protein
MAEFLSDTQTDSTPETRPDAKPSAPARRARRAVLLDAGLEVLSLAALAFVAVGFSAYAGRREVSRELAVAWLEDKGIEASLELEDVDATGFAGAIRLGPKNAPVFSAERIEVAYDLAAPWSGSGSGSGSGGKFALNARAIRLVRPRLSARLDQNGLNFGSLQPLIDQALKSPADPNATGPAILIEDARVTLRTPGGAARLTGDASLDDGKLLRFDGRLAPLRYATRDLSFDTAGMLVKARKRGERLNLDIDLDVRALSAGPLGLTEAEGSLRADIAYPDLKRLSMVGPADLRIALKAKGADLDTAALGEVEANLAVTGLLSGDLKRGGFTGRSTLHARGGRLTAQAVDSRDVVADLDLSNLAVTYDPAGTRGAARTRLAATAEKTVAGGAALSRASVEVRSTSLTLVSDANSQSLSGPMSVALGSGRVAVGGVVLSSLAADGQGRLSTGTTGISLALDGQAGADGAMSAPDALRLTQALPNPDHARAAAVALSRFEVSAPALRLAISGGQTRLFLPRPVVATGVNGAKATLSASGGPLVATAGDGASGRATLALGGGGLPDLTLDAPNWRSGPSGLTSDVMLAGVFDAPPVTGLAGTLSGQAQLVDDVLTVRLGGCTPLTARTWAMGEPPISDLRFELCPTDRPLVRVAGGAWRASARVAKGKAEVKVAQARVEDLTATFEGGGRGGFDEAQVRVTGGRLVDAAPVKRFNPVVAAGAVTLARARWTGGFDAATPSGRPLGRVVLRHDVITGQGEAVIDASKLAFAKGGLQPAELSPMAELAKEAEGPASFTGRFDWKGETMTSGGRLSTPGLNFESPLGPVATLKGQVAFTSLAPLVSAPDQVLTAASIAAIVPIQTVTATFTLGEKSLRLSSTTFDASKGKISIEPIDVPLDGQGGLKSVINIAHLDLGELVAGSSMADKIAVEAIVDGRLPFALSPAGFRFLDGKIYATRPGRLSIAREALTGVDVGLGASGGTVDPNDPLTLRKAAPVNAIQDFAYQAMENLRFETLEAGVNSDGKGRLGVLFHIKGEHDPKIAEKARIGLMELLNGSAFQRRIPLPAKTPVDLTLDTSLNFDELLAAWRRGWLEEEPATPAPPATPAAPEASRSDGVQP